MTEKENSKPLDSEEIESREKLASQFIDNYLIPASNNLFYIEAEIELVDVMAILFEDFVEKNQTRDCVNPCDVAFVLQSRVTAIHNVNVSNTSNKKEADEIKSQKKVNQKKQ